MSATRHRIVLATYGSLGDLFPYVAIAEGLQERGHDVVVAGPAAHRRRVEALGLAYRDVRPDTAWMADGDRIRRFMSARGIIDFVANELFPALPEWYADTLAACEGADLLVSHPLSGYVGRLIAEKTGLAWVSTAPVPLRFFSTYDPSIFPLWPRMSHALRYLGRPFWGPAFWIGKRTTRSIAEPWERFRKEIGLPRSADVNPLSDSHSPRLELALFSRLLAAPQPDWPPQTKIVGFPFPRDRTELSGELEAFLAAGPPPVVFTLGSAVVSAAGDFYEESAAAAKLAGRRAVLVVGGHDRNRPKNLGDDVLAVEYASFSKLFARSAAIVHHGGIGTTGLAMQSGRPALIVPFAWDQPDNAARASRLGTTRVLAPNRYRAARVASELRRLLDGGDYVRRAGEVGEGMRTEDGVAAACDSLEEALRAR